MDSEKQDLIKVHKKLGPSRSECFSSSPKMNWNGADDHIAEDAKEFVCDACVETNKFKHKRPAKLHDPTEQRICRGRG